MQHKFKSALSVLVLASAAFGGGHAFAQTQGVSKDQITIGSIQDLSGPLAGLGKPARLGLQMRVDEINEQGGIHGRKLKLIVEDSAYDPKRAVLAAQKLVNQDKIFAMIGSMGTAPTVATFPVLIEKNVFSLFPITAAREMYEPLHKLKYAYFSNYYDQIKQTVTRLVKEKDAKKVCLVYQDDDFGLEVLRGSEDGLKTIGMTLTEKTSYKRGATDFSSQIARLKAASCDFVVLGTVLRETIGAMAEARKAGFNPTFLGSAAAYNANVPKLGGKAVDGLYAAMTAQEPYLDDESEQIRTWANKYKAKFNEEPTTYSVSGYCLIDAFANAANKAGSNLTVESFSQAMDSLTIPASYFGSPELTFSPAKHLGNELSRLSQVRDGRWKVVSDYLK
ncbi:MAG: ABC transporter substrate-binding protein [Desulfovibrionaceae bacterium]|nr:ABC transporter substrate-binding protein [Desulfovibrionaceae bacterium]